jgi:hypothetical protein
MPVVVVVVVVVVGGGGGAVLSPQVSVQVPRYLLFPGTAATWPVVQTPMIDEDDFWSNWWNENWPGKPKYSEKTYPSATLSTTKSHMTDLVSNPGPQRWEPSD